MMKKITLLGAALLITTCIFAQKDIPSAQPGVEYGEGVNASKHLTVTKLEKKLNKDSVYTGSVTGDIVEVCTKKGCFMKLTDDKTGELITVRFKDYGFFMPQDIVGKTVAVEGDAKVTEHSVKQLQHWAEDAGKSSEEIAAIQEPKRTIEIIATGVKVLK
ncbi:DUF4920 domain-containing protein [Albibacterium indicum]|uniref:DUF4920 domain-containing protein n=1 Tax=Albibacterium indicum TaxID=2292082 RepID=UPI001FEAF30E|nr:DUF4920 domain-containing protein [Pedobacter indicus]